MQTRAIRQAKVRSWKLIASFIGTAGILFLLFQFTDVETISQLLQGAKWFWVLVGFGWYGVTNVCRSYRFAGLLGWEGWRKAFWEGPIERGGGRLRLVLG